MSTPVVNAESFNNIFNDEISIFYFSELFFFLCNSGKIVMLEVVTITSVFG